MNGFVGSFRWCWDPGRWWILRGVPFWIDLTCLETAMVGSSGVRTGRCAIWLCLWWRRLLLCLTYLLVEVDQHGAWVLSVLGGLLFSGLMLAYCFVCCLIRLMYVSLTDYHLMMGHDGLYACWCVGCAWFTRSAEGLHFLCCFTWIEVFPFVSKLVSPYTTFKQIFARWRICCSQIASASILTIKIASAITLCMVTLLLGVLLDVLESVCVLIGVGSYRFRLVCLMYSSFCTPAWVLSSRFCEIVFCTPGACFMLG